MHILYTKEKSNTKAGLKCVLTMEPIDVDKGTQAMGSNVHLPTRHYSCSVPSETSTGTLIHIQSQRLTKSENKLTFMAVLKNIAKKRMYSELSTISTVTPERASLHSQRASSLAQLKLRVEPVN